MHTCLRSAYISLQLTINTEAVAQPSVNFFDKSRLGPKFKWLEWLT